jgi:hypothetical protein
MKISQSIIHGAIIAGLIMPLFAVAADDENVNLETIEYTNSEDEFTPCGVTPEIDFVENPKEIKRGEVSYVSGGICEGGVEQMKSLAKKFPLEIVLVEKTEEKEKEGYIADVKIKITDAKDNLILDVSTEGPYLLANMPSGKYTITAEYDDVVKTKLVNVNKNKHKRVVFLWTTEPLEK